MPFQTQEEQLPEGSGLFLAQSLQPLPTGFPVVQSTGMFRRIRPSPAPG